MSIGFYQPAQLIADAKKHNVIVRPIDINYSDWDNKLEEKEGKFCVLRLGFRQVKGLRPEDIEILVSARNKMYNSVNELRDISMPEAALIKLSGQIWFDRSVTIPTWFFQYFFIRFLQNRLYPHAHT